jgi:hypothetical protein
MSESYQRLLESVSPGRHERPVARTPGYDPNGNLTSDSNISDGGTITSNGQWTYVWDAENRFVSMKTTPAAVTAGRPGRKLTFAYAWTGRRLARTVTDTNNTVLLATRWRYDGWNPVAEYAGQVLDKTCLWGMDMCGGRRCCAPSGLESVG